MTEPKTMEERRRECGMSGCRGCGTREPRGSNPNDACGMNGCRGCSRCMPVLKDAIADSRRIDGMFERERGHGR